MIIWNISKAVIIFSSGICFFLFPPFIQAKRQEKWGSGGVAMACGEIEVCTDIFEKQTCQWHGFFFLLEYVYFLEFRLSMHKVLPFIEKYLVVLKFWCSKCPWKLQKDQLDEVGFY